MTTLTVSTNQVIELARKLPPEEQRRVLDTLRRDEIGRRWRYPLPELIEHVREMATERGRNWDRMTDQEQEDFINDVLHEE